MENSTEKQWKLGIDLHINDNLLDGITFHEIITAVQHNCPVIKELTVRHQVLSILNDRITDMRFLCENNMEAIITAAKEEQAKA